MGKSDAGTVWTVNACAGVTVTASASHQGIDPVIAAGVALGMNPQIEVNLCRRGKDEGPIGHR